MTEIIVYHNPECGTSRNVLALIRNAAVERARMTQTAVVNALNAAAERIEKSTQILNRTVGNGKPGSLGERLRQAYLEYARTAGAS